MSSNNGAWRIYSGKLHFEGERLLDDGVWLRVSARTDPRGAPGPFRVHYQARADLIVNDGGLEATVIRRVTYVTAEMSLAELKAWFETASSQAANEVVGRLRAARDFVVEPP